MYVNEEKRVMYLSTPKTGTTATCRALVKNGFKFHGNGRRFRKESPTIRMGHHVGLDQPPPEGYIVITAVRNPFDILVSWYHYQHDSLFVRGPLTDLFVDWLFTNKRNARFFPRPDSLLSLHLEYATDIIKWENLEVNLNEVLARRDIPYLTLEKHNVSKKRKADYKEYYEDRDFREYIEDRFKFDFETFGYSF